MWYYTHLLWQRDIIWCVSWYWTTDSDLNIMAMSLSDPTLWPSYSGQFVSSSCTTHLRTLSNERFQWGFFSTGWTLPCLKQVWIWSQASLLMGNSLSLGRKDIVQLPKHLFGPATCMKLKLGVVNSPLLERGLNLTTIFMASSLFFKARVYLKITQVFFWSQFTGTLGDLINNSMPGVQVKHSFDKKQGCLSEKRTTQMLMIHQPFGEAFNVADGQIAQMEEETLF